MANCWKLSLNKDKLNILLDYDSTIFRTGENIDYLDLWSDCTEHVLPDGSTEFYFNIGPLLSKGYREMVLSGENQCSLTNPISWLDVVEPLSNHNLPIFK